MALAICKIKDLHGKELESSVNVKVMITQKGDLQKSSTKKDYVK